MSSKIVISPLIRVILGRLVDIDQSIASTYPQLDEIRKSLQYFNSVILDAEQRVEEESLVFQVLLRLQVRLEVVDDLIDEVQMVSSNSQQSQLIPKQVSLSVFRFSPFSQSKKLAQSLQYITVILADIANDFLGLGFHVTHTNVGRPRQGETISYVDRSMIIGRDKDEAAVIDLLSKPVSDRASVVPIFGFFSVGKTALAQSIFNDPEIKGKFDLSLWLSLPQESGSDAILEILRGSLIQLEGAIQVEDDRDVEQMKTDLHKLLEKQRALIVLDGFEDITLHKSVLTLLQDMGSEGSAVIVTTRSRRVASMIGTTTPYQLNPLQEDPSYQLLTSIHGDETQIAKEMVKLCSGVPLFLRMLASYLPKISQGEDRGIANFIFENEIDRSECLDRGRLGYLTLPLQCFRLQKACGMSVQALTCVWMALGFLYSDGPNQQLESIATKYLLDLVDSGLCPDVEYAPGGVVGRIKFNDALFEFATYSRHQQWGFSVLDQYTRFIIWDEDSPSAISALYSKNQVRLFILCSRRQPTAGMVNDIVSSFKALRVLGFGGCNIKLLPDSIGELKHLRYLDVGSNPRIKRLPASICYLWHLQTLLLHGCSQLEELPAKLGTLQNLRYLTLTIIKESLPDEMGDLVSLRTLGLSSCPRLASLPSSIKNLNNLQTLGIADCNVLDLRAATSYEGLKGLDAMNTLLLSHLPRFVGLPTDLGNPSVAMKHLMIQSCPNLIQTTWIVQFRSLHSLTIEDCSQLPALTLADGTSQLDGLLELVIRRCPSLDNTEWVRKLKSLRSLIINDCPKLVELDVGFSELEKLKRLEIRRCPGLSPWFANPAGQNWLHSVHHVQVIEVDGERLGS